MNQIDRVQQYEATSFQGSDKNRRKRKVSVTPCQYIYTAHATKEVTGGREKTLNVGKPNNLVLIRSTTISHNNANNAGIGNGQFSIFYLPARWKIGKTTRTTHVRTYVRTYGAGPAALFSDPPRGGVIGWRPTGGSRVRFQRNRDPRSTIPRPRYTSTIVSSVYSGDDVRT